MTAAAGAVTELLGGRLGDELRLRIDAAAADARRVLGLADEPAGAASVDDIATLAAELAALLAGDAAADAAGAAHNEQLARLRRRYEQRFDALERIGGAVARLRTQTSPTTMLARAPRELCDGSDFERAVISLVREGAIVAEAAWFAGDESGARAALAALRADAPRLERPLVETEVLRRRRATIVVDADVHPRVHRSSAQVMRWTTYVAAPLVVRSTVVGVIHADRGPGAPLDVVHRDVLWRFAEGLAHAYETASLRRTLRQERDRMRQFLEWLGARSGELGDAAGDLVAPDRPPLAATLESGDAPMLGAGRDDSALFAGLLTRRELDVVRLMAEGQSTKAIAAELVLSPGTIKFHVNNILRKLHAANRAQAVSRYFALLNARAPGP